MAMALWPCVVSASTAACTALSFRSASATDAPDSAKAFAVARPSPDAAPVTSATFPSNEIFMTKSLPVLLVADLIHPVDVLAVERFLHRDMRHAGGRRCAVPMFLAGRKPHHVAWPDLFNRSSFGLYPSKTSRDDQSLAERMRVPRGAR